MKTTVLLAVCTVLNAVGVAYAQSAAGNVNGTVTDPSSASVAGARLLLRNQDTGIESEAVTNVNGYFSFVNVKPGEYSLDIEMTGFKKAQIPTFTVGVNQSLTHNVTLEIGSVADIVEVAATAELLQASSSELGNVVEAKVVHELPLNGRNFTQLLVLTPGVNPVSTAQGSQREVNFGAAEGNTGIPNSPLANASIQGQQNRSKIYFLDGIINTSVRGTSYVVLPDIDSLQEFKVQSHNDKAEFGGVTGGVVNMYTKSGTNAFHGSAFWFVRNEVFDARDPFRDALVKDPPKFRQNQFGANVGGPVLRNRTFFFAGYDGWRYRDVANEQKQVFTDRELSGDFSQSFYNRAIYNPFSWRTENGRQVADPFPNRVIPRSVMSAQMQGFFQTYANKPNLTGDARFNFRQTRARKNDANALQTRIDHQFRTSDNLFFRWNEQVVSTFNPLGQEGSKTPEATNRNYGGGWLHSFTPSVILEVRGGVATQPTEDAPLEHTAGIDPMKQLGFKDVDKFGGALVSLSAQPWAGVSGNDFGTQGLRPRENPNWNFSTNLSWQRGNHNYKAGFQLTRISRLQVNNFQQFLFDRVPTSDPQNPGTTGDDLASALIGVPSQVRSYVPEVGSIDFSTGTWSAFFQDEWKIRRNVTVTYGLRYDYVMKATGNGLQSGPDMSTGQWLIAAEQLPGRCASGTPPPCLPATRIEDVPFHQYIKVTGEPFSILQPIKDNWGPRLGLAWQLTNTTVLRGGFGLVWDALPSRSQYGQHQFETWGWPQASGYDTGSINRPGQPIQSVAALQGNIPFGTPRPAPWDAAGAWFNAPDRKDAYSQQWHVEIQRQITQGMMASAAYVGSSNGRLEYTGVAPALSTPGFDSTGRRLTPAEVNARRPWAHMTGSFNYQTDLGYSSYHALQTKLQQRFGYGLTTLLSYTWSKSIDVSSGFANAENGIGGNSNVQNFHDIDSNRAVSSYDVPHILTWATVYELPFGRGKSMLNSGPLSAVLGNWQLNGTMMARSGQPFTVEVTGDIANIGNTRTYMRANVTGDPKLNNPTASKWFNTDAFTIPVNSFGNAGRNILRTDGVFNFDLGLQKNVRIAEGKQLQFRAEAFNLFNHIDLGNPEHRIQQPTFGQVTSTSHQPRQLQFGLRFVY